MCFLHVYKTSYGILLEFWRLWQCASHVSTRHHMTSCFYSEVRSNVLPTCLQDVIWHPAFILTSVAMCFLHVYKTSYGILLEFWRPWQCASHVSIYTRHHMTSTLNSDVRGYVLPTCLYIQDIIWHPPWILTSVAMCFSRVYKTSYDIHLEFWRPWQCASHVSTRHHMTSSLNFDVRGNVLPTCLRDIIWHPAFILTSVAMCFPPVYDMSYDILLEFWRQWQCASYMSTRHHMTSALNFDVRGNVLPTCLKIQDVIWQPAFSLKSVVVCFHC